MAYGPIFIGGVSFSGKTQLRLLLNMHSNILITRHTYFWRKYYGKYGDLRLAENLDRCLAELCASKQAQALKSDLASIRAEFAAGPADYSRLFSIFHRQNTQAAGKSRWGIQQSFVECEADLLFNDLPDARILHVIRNPTERIEESTMKSHRLGKVGAESALWLQSSRWAERNKELYPDRYMLVHWESLKAQPDAILREVCAFIGVGFEVDMLAAADFSTQRFNGYRRLSSTERSFIQVWTRREMTQLGYTLQSKPLKIGEALSFAFFDYPVNSIFALLTEKTSKFPSPTVKSQNRGNKT
jgi:hypothetical protein